MTKLNQLTEIGQSIWYDNIRRALIDSGELQALLDAGVMGVTSNPSIFEKAIAGSADYDKAIQSLGQQDQDDEKVYETLALEDIQRTADMLRPIYDKTNGVDGYISLEVSPTLAHDTDGTIADARRFFAALDRPNVMIKVPATPEGIPAIETLIGEGININVTLIFALSSYEAVAQAYLRGLEKFAAAGGDLSKIASVASFFVSRVDAAVDAALDAAGNTELKGKIAIANSKAAYHRFHELFSGERWQKLADQGARVQRLLWASTGVKNPSYPDTLYMDALIGAHTVNTVPPATLTAFMDHGSVGATLGEEIETAMAQLSQLDALGIDLDAITQKLQDDGVASFIKSFESLIASVAEKRERLAAGHQCMQANLGSYQAQVDTALAEVKESKLVQRIWEHDYTVWRPEPDEIVNRLGWLYSPENMGESVERIMGLVSAVRADGYDRVLLMGMGGSSLAPEVFQKVFGKPAGAGNDFLEISILDSTDPDMLLDIASKHDMAKTLFVVATKSGGTAETLSAFKYFYNRVIEEIGVQSAGQHFIAITDPGSSLIDLAQRYKFRDTFLNDPNIGGRYAALSFFGLVPAGLTGVDLSLLLSRAETMACNTASCNCPVGGDNIGASLGTVMGELAKMGRDKITILVSPEVESFGDWVEQLIAESTGKDGMGILPVVGEALGTPEMYSDDRLFVHLQLEGDDTHAAALAALEAAGHPVLTLALKDKYDLGQQFFLWEMATAIAGSRINIQPFDQPNVESAKILARQMVAEYMETGQLPSGEFAELSGNALKEFIAQAKKGDYVSIHAYVHPMAETDQALDALRLALRDHLKVATTVGYGPRFLHSTGQLHKGDGGNGLFIQFSSDPAQDVPIPDEAGKPDSTMSFGVLKNAQALGDAQALKNVDRRLIRFHVGKDVAKDIQSLTMSITGD